MNTKLQVQGNEDKAITDHGFDRVLSGNNYQVITALGSEDMLKAVNDDEKHKLMTKTAKLAKTGLFIKNVGLFLVSPFIALAYIFALPFVGFYMFTKLMLEAQAKNQTQA